MDWQPISEAPKGTIILRYIPEQLPDAWGHNGLSARLDIGRGAHYGMRQATHWMPLPESPAPTP